MTSHSRRNHHSEMGSSRERPSQHQRDPHLVSGNTKDSADKLRESKHDSRKRKRKRRSPSSSSSSSRSSSRHKRKRKKSKSKNKKKKHRRRSSSSSSSTSSSDSSTSSSSETSSSEEDKKRKKKLKKRRKKKKEEKRRKLKKKKLKAKEKAKKKSREAEIIGPSVGPSITQKDSVEDQRDAGSRNMKPMTKEEWEKKQSVVRRVYDPETGRNRLVKGDGEIIEEIVSKDRHREINKQSTLGDGLSYASRMGILK